MSSSSSSSSLLAELAKGIPLKPLPPPQKKRDSTVPHAPKRTPKLSNEEFQLCIANALRYFPPQYHELLATEFVEEMKDYGHIYMYRFRPTSYPMKAYPIHYYPAKCKHARVIQLMIMNNLDPEVAQYPHELITYGGNGSVFSNWAQYHLTMQYLSELTEEQTLVMMSGHPQGLFPSRVEAPRLVITNGMTIPNYSSKDDYDRLYAQGNSIYGQMTAGSYCYIGPQGIVHGTTITILNAGRKYLGLQSLAKSGTVYVSSGLGGMSGAQGKASMVCECVGVIAEIDERAVQKRYKQGWVKEVINDLDALVKRIRIAKEKKETTAIAYHGNIVDVWEKLADLDDMLVELGSDQTSLHNPFNGGYYPVGYTLEEAQKLMTNDPKKFKAAVEESLRRQVNAINRLVNRGMRFWDYGNCFLLEASRAGADIMDNKNKKNFKYPSYVQDIMGDIFSLGFGPFRWVCTSGQEKDLAKSDAIAEKVLRSLHAKEKDTRVQGQLDDNIFWIQNALENKLVVGSQARILYANALGRIHIAVELNAAIGRGDITGPIVLSRDHHDVSGTDSPFRETSNIYDGSAFCADMAVQNFAGDGFRGATWIALHNGGGVGWGEVINGGFGLVLDGTKEAQKRAEEMLFWDVNNGIARRAWAGNENAKFMIERAMKENRKIKVTMPNTVVKSILDKACNTHSRL